jgi:hypothetical protein
MTARSLLIILPVFLLSMDALPSAKESLPC